MTIRLELPFLLAVVVASPSAVLLAITPARQLAESGDLFGREHPIPIALIGVAVAVASLVYGSLMLNHDSSWYLVATRQWLAGVPLYAGIMEINPPLAFFLTVPALWIADVFGTSDSTAFVVYVVALCGVALLAVRRLLRDTTVLTPLAKRGVFLGVLLALFVAPFDAFGQREHLMLILTMPYLLTVAMSPRGVRTTRVTAVALGSAAAIGFSLKPHFLAAPILLWLAVGLQTRGLRGLATAANGAVVVVGLGYVSLVWVGFPDYFTRIVPLGVLTYGSFGSGFSLALAQPMLVFAPLAIALVLRDAGRGEDRQVATRLLAVVLGFAISYLVQAKGWHYQILPLTAFLIIVLTWSAVIRAGNVRAVAWPSTVGALLVVSYSLARGPYRNPNVEAFAPFVATAGEAPAILVLSSNVSAAFPLVNVTRARWTSRFPAQWLVPGAVAALAAPACSAPSACRRHRAALDSARQMVVEDFLDGQPAIVIVDERLSKPYFGGVPFNYLTWLAEDRRFGARFERYSQVGHRRDYSIWRLKQP